MPINRRCILSAAAVLPALAVPAVGIPDSPDADVFAAAQAVENAWRALGRVRQPMTPADEVPELPSAERQLADTRATTMDGLRCKARIAALLREQDHAVRPITGSLVQDLLALR
jgi:hypothetical protein